MSEPAASSPSECRPSSARARTSGVWSSRLVKRARGKGELARAQIGLAAGQGETGGFGWIGSKRGCHFQVPPGSLVRLAERGVERCGFE